MPQAMTSATLMGAVFDGARRIPQRKAATCGLPRPSFEGFPVTVGPRRMRRHLKDLEYWRTWWRERVPLEDKIVAGVFLLLLLLGGGWLAANSLSSASASAGGNTGPLFETVERLVTVQGPGKVVKVKERVPVIKRIYVRPKRQATSKAGPASTVYLTSTVVRTIPSYRPYPVTQPARTVTQVVTKTVVHTEWKVLQVVQPVTVTVTAPSP